MNFKIASVFFISCLVAVNAADINTIRKEAIKRLDIQVAALKKLADDTVLEAEKNEGNVKVICKHEREYGEGILESTQFQMARNARSAYMLANLLLLKNEVHRCIDTRHREAKDDTDRSYAEKFFKPAVDYEAKAEQSQRNLMKSWKDDYYRALSQYQEIYRKAVADINKSTSESYIVSVVKNFEQNSEQMAKIITNVLTGLRQIHVSILRILENLISGLKEFSKYRIDKTFEQINQCFPRSNLIATELDFLL